MMRLDPLLCFNTVQMNPNKRSVSRSFPLPGVLRAYFVDYGID